VAFVGAGKPSAAGSFTEKTQVAGPQIPDWSKRFFNVAGATNALGLEKPMALAGKKRETRKSVRQSGWITLDGGFAARPCVVVDLSTAGAKVTVDDSQALGSKLRLAFSRDARTGRSCEVVWRRGKTMGVKFIG
jgi:hypothetical protein